MTIATITAPKFRPVRIDAMQSGCGYNFHEARWFVERVEDGKLMKDVGPAKVKWAAEVEAQAHKIAESMNARAA